MAENVCGLGCGDLGQKRKLTQTTETSGKRNGSGGLGDLLLFKIQAATSCWEFRMRQGRMEPRGSGASQVGQRSWSSSLEILCWFCLLPFCWWVPRDADAAQLFSSCRYPPGQFTYKYCTAFIAYGSGMSGEGTPRSGDRRQDIHSLASVGDTCMIFTSLVATETLLLSFLLPVAHYAYCQAGWQPA